MTASTHTLLRAQAEAYADGVFANMPLSVLINAVASKAIYDAIRDAYMRGADAGYTAAKAEERKP